MPNKITPCSPGSQKCVSTVDTQEYCAMEPVPFSGSVDEVMQVVDQVIAAYPRTTVLDREPDYAKAIFRTKVLRFKDTVEFEADADASLLHFRSESVPYAGSDLGANRKRMTEVRAMLMERLG